MYTGFCPMNGSPSFSTTEQPVLYRQKNTTPLVHSQQQHKHSRTACGTLPTGRPLQCNTRARGRAFVGP
ncbi:hypothetical protein BC827DRAFT_1252322 [Russula dissimulans]|nr:hypothetical protein BC827DRAFT_1252322 [Russula dissimulans]